MNYTSEVNHDGLINANLLIVDDDKINREILSSLLIQENYNILETDNGRSAINMALEHRPDLILLDVMMPEIDGIEVCRELKKNKYTSNIPVVLVTSMPSSEAETEALAAGAADFITKPINSSRVIARVRAQLQFKRQRDDLINKSEQLFFANKLLEQEIEEHLKTEANLRSAKGEIAAANIVRDGLIKDLFQAMCEMLSSRDMYTFEHGLRVASISRLIGEDIGLSTRKLDALEIGCMLHDISKVAIPDDILLKPGMFDFQDREIMRMHPEMGAKIFMRRSCDPLIIDIIHHHHERLDGSGYPDGLIGDDIGLLPRIAMVADTYEALISRRSYKKPVDRANAIEILRGEVKNGRLDADIVECLVKVTENWNPLELYHDYADSNIKALEVFRKKAYFREPLSDFYNYRYLFFLAESGLLEISEDGFALFGISFVNVDFINKTEGYRKTDQIIDDAGSILHEIIDETSSDSTINSTILLRKEKIYLIFSNAPEELLQLFEDKINRFIEVQGRELGLKSRLVKQKFPKDKLMEEAVYDLIEKCF